MKRGSVTSDKRHWSDQLYGQLFLLCSCSGKLRSQPFESRTPKNRMFLRWTWIHLIAQEGNCSSSVKGSYFILALILIHTDVSTPAQCGRVAAPMHLFKLQVHPFEKYAFTHEVWCPTKEGRRIMRPTPARSTGEQYNAPWCKQSAWLAVDTHTRAHSIMQRYDNL